MFRVFSLFGMTSGFLVISPGFRGTLLDSFAQVVAKLDQYSPYSYIGVAVALLGCLMAAFCTSTPR